MTADSVTAGERRSVTVTDYVMEMGRRTRKRGQAAAHRVVVVSGRPPRHRPAPTEPRPKNKKRRRLIAIITAVVVLLIVGASVWANAPRSEHNVAAAATKVVPLPAFHGSQVGAADPGTTRYPIPANSIFVSPAGSDSAAGAVGTPLATLASAIKRAKAHQTIVLRAGTYHESVTIPDNRTGLTIQSYPGEAVWLDGSTPVDGWAVSGPAWIHNDWTARFDSTNSFIPGQPDPTFLSADYPMAAHPDQVWIDGKAQQQVSSTDDVVPGAFYVDYQTHQLLLGTDPAGHDVRASDVAQALVSNADRVTLRGFGVRRYATPIVALGAVRITGADTLVENVVLSQNATIGISIGHGNGITLSKVTVDSNGFLGVHANYADDMRITKSKITNNNTEHFNREPVSGGVKITRSRGVTIDSNDISNNVTNGLWFDESVYDMKVIDNALVSNGHFGIEAEISAKILFVGNLVAHNVSTGVMLLDVSDATVWNNTLVDNWREFDVYQDSRDINDSSVAGRDKRQTYPDPTMTWKNGPIDFVNNVLVGGREDYLFVLQDGSDQRSWSQMGLTAKSNLYQSGAAKTAIVDTGPSDVGYRHLSDYQTATGLEAHSRDATWIVLNGDLHLSLTSTTVGGNIATPLPAGIAKAVGQPVGSKYVGSLITFP